MSAFWIRMLEYLTPLNWLWMLPPLAAGYVLYRVCTAFLPVKPRLRWKLLLWGCISTEVTVVIWVGDNNMLFALPPFYLILMLCSRGDRMGRLTVTTIFFCMIMSVNGLMDTYLEELTFWAYTKNLTGYDYYDAASRLLRPLFWGGLWLWLRRHLPEEPPRLSPRLWRMTGLLAAMPLSSMLAVVLLTWQKYDSAVLQGVSAKLGLAVLPFVFFTSLALLFLLKTLDDAQRLEREQHLASLRESYYQGLQREQRQLRTLRHDLRNHLTVVQGLLEQGETDRAEEYVQELAGSPALGRSLRLCENETANAVLAAKLQAMEQMGLKGHFSVALPPDLPIAAPDLCALLGNALDNAMEAAEQAQDKGIDLRCRVEKGLFMLRVENAAEGPRNPDLTTTKADKTAHGFGLAGMREIARRCGGSLETRAEEGRFELVACLPVTETNSGP